MSIRLAFYLSTGCMGCEMSIVDALADMYDALSQHEIVWSSPLFASSKYDELESMDDEYIDVTFIEGGVNSDETERIVRLLRKKSKRVVALGTCAVHGGVPALSAFHEVDEILEEVYGETIPARQDVVEGKYRLSLPAIERQRRISEVIQVDHFIPGCPPKPEKLVSVFRDLENLDDLWITSGKSVCSFCERSPAREGRGFRKIEKIRRVSWSVLDVEGCFLEDGYLCFGFATAGDCEADCPNSSVPCRGCYGPLPDIGDFGAKVIDGLIPLLTGESAEDLLSQYPELSKLLYIYRASSLRE